MKTVQSTRHACRGRKARLSRSFRRDSDLFGEGSKAGGAERFAAALKRGFQTRSVEIDLARFLAICRKGLNFSLASQ
jgi:hypothetical protein